MSSSSSSAVSSEVPDEDIPDEEGVAIEAVSDAEIIDLRLAEEVRVFEEAKIAQRAKLDEVRLKQQQDGTTTNAEKRLAYLMAQSEVFTQFLYGSALDDPASGAPSMAAGGKKGGGGGRRTRMTEDAEDKQMLKAAQSSVVVTRLLKQPSNISGTMRPYQLEGLNWLIKLHDNAVNGILADE
jgi:SWI/SNF-related matrix-associated actin-dependent regulator of chromatin subfamily A member 5